MLADAGWSFEIIPTDAEEIHDASIAPPTLCECNAHLKAQAVARQAPDAYVIGADTLVFIDNQPLGKPKSLEEAHRMLQQLSGRTHQVCTGVCIIDPTGVAHTFHDTTEVTFLPLNDAQIAHYFTLANPMDKAGAYGIQEHGECIIESVHGELDTVIGLPVQRLSSVLKQLLASSNPQNA